ncbi:uncharacterized protein (DUF1778 family) [Microbacterium foliorum]|uniref:Uncharacterized protein (DUF1778 family) n=1 Tax=Microbacterium foliorum TaxID=104336 RepID=A0ABU1HXI0_9MICO|nr:DUF1778 domain-containing protein [Microbacterium foliorum]MDR6143820.1 uncharacterized protein (DUF1778 family) [Microbacterium foliorum]
MTTTERLELRIPGEQKSQVEHAAALRGMTTSAFVRDAVIERTQEVIRAEREIRLNSEAWERFSAAIDAPGVPVAGLAELLTRKSVFG